MKCILKNCPYRFEGQPNCLLFDSSPSSFLRACHVSLLYSTLFWPVPQSLHQTLCLSDLGMWGHTFTFAGRLSHIHEHAQHTQHTGLVFHSCLCEASCLQCSQPLILPGKRNPSTPNQTLTVWLAEARGLTHLLLSVSCIDRMGERPPPPFPAHQLCWQVQASKGLPLCPIHAHQHMWWTPAVGASPGPLNREGSAFPPWVGLGGMLVCILHWLDGWGQGWAPCICQGATAHPRGLLVCLWLLSGSTWMEISTGKWMHGGATDKESRELRGQMLCR